MTKEELRQKTISAISLGCDKNKVDLEKMLGRLKEYGFNISSDIYSADIVIVNTCAFIQPAQEEAIMNILEMEKLKADGIIEKVIVTGCFPERNFNSMTENFPTIDKFLRLKDNENICSIIENLYNVSPSKPLKKYERVLTNSPSYAYLKIADGCDNVCSYCTIPRIRGRYKSEKMEDIIDEAKNLVERGVKELILIAQDTTRYGEDLYGENKLIELCEKLSKIKGLNWIRLHYLYPEKLNDKLLSFISNNEKMCKYIDIPLQHIDDEILHSMRRRLGEKETRQLLDKIKSSYPELAIRSTFIVGYPGETRSKFKKLCEFIKEIKFDYAGFFPYSKEPNTASFFMKKQMKEWTKNRRFKKIKTLQNKIALENIKGLIGSDIDVLVDEFDSNSGEFCGHSQKLSPLVDFGVRFVDNGSVQCSSIVKVKITDFDGSDLKGEVL